MSAYESLRGMLDKLHRAVLVYGDHRPHCPAAIGQGWCSCNWSKEFVSLPRPEEVAAALAELDREPGDGRLREKLIEALGKCDRLAPTDREVWEDMADAAMRVFNTLSESPEEQKAVPLDAETRQRLIDSLPEEQG